jgi:hypothetical protein
MDNFKLIHTVVIIDWKKDAVYHSYGLFITYMEDKFTYVRPKGPSSGNTYISVTKNTYWVMSCLYINQISFLPLVGLYWRVIGVCIDIDCIVDLVESGWELFIFLLSNTLIHFPQDLQYKRHLHTSTHTPIVLQYNPIRCKNEMYFINKPLINQ